MLDQITTQSEIENGVEIVLNASTEKEIAEHQKKTNERNALKRAIEMGTRSKEAVDALSALVPDYANFDALQGKANDALYNLLEDILEIVMNVKKFRNTLESKAERKRFDDALDNEMSSAKIDFTEATSLERKIVRFVIRPNSNDNKQKAISQSREKSWARALMQAQKQEEIVSGSLKLSSLLYATGGVSVLSSIDKAGKTSSQRSDEKLKKALTFVSTHFNKENIPADVVSSKVQSDNKKIKADNADYKRFSVSLNFGGNNVMTIRDDLAIARMLEILGTAIDKKNAKEFHTLLATIAELKDKSEKKQVNDVNKKVETSNEKSKMTGEQLLEHIRNRKK